MVSAVSCALGKKNSSGDLLGLLPGFLGAPVVCVNFLLFKATARNSSSSFALDICGGGLP